MPSPFPGMDPYLEGSLWPDVHHELASEIRTRLNAHIAPRYVARIVIQTVVEEINTGETVGIMVPDVEIFSGRTLQQTRTAPAAVLDSTITPATATIPQPFEVEIDIPSVEIYQVASGRLVTSIEILSPTNKRRPNWNDYQLKRLHLMQAQAHLLEIDWLRRGRRHVTAPITPRAPYYVFLTRAQRQKQVEIWAIQLRDALPTVPVPLRAPDPDVPLDLQAAFNTIYDRARYDLSIDYSKPPDPELDISDAAWAEEMLKQKFAS